MRLILTSILFGLSTTVLADESEWDLYNKLMDMHGSAVVCAKTRQGLNAKLLTIKESIVISAPGVGIGKGDGFNTSAICVTTTKVISQ